MNTVPAFITAFSDNVTETDTSPAIFRYDVPNPDERFIPYCINVEDGIFYDESGERFYKLNDETYEMIKDAKVERYCYYLYEDGKDDCKMFLEYQKMKDRLMYSDEDFDPNDYHNVFDKYDIDIVH